MIKIVPPTVMMRAFRFIARFRHVTRLGAMARGGRKPEASLTDKSRRHVQQTAQPQSLTIGDQMRNLNIFAFVSILAACKFPDLEPVDVDARIVGETDAAPDAGIDAPVACVPSSIDCDDTTDIYTECSAQGQATLQIVCPLGCSPSTEKCVDLDPSNGLAMYLDMAQTAPDLVLTGTSSINPWDGAILVGANAVQVPNFSTPTGLRVFVVRSLSIDGTVTVVRRYATSPLAIVSHGDVHIAGLLDISAQGAEGGAGGMWGADQSSPNNCGGGWPNGKEGGGGGGGAETGAAGGPTESVAGAAGGPLMTFVEPLSGGCEGGTNLAGDGSLGGGGGGGLQISSRTRITVSGAGTIDASGGGAYHRGASGFRISGGGGGGGGNIILEAPQVVLDGPSVVISTKGGGGAGASTNSSSSGADGGYDAAAAPGGTSPIQANGGRGGTGANVPFAGQFGGCSNCESGGGGGAAGMTMFRNLAGAIAPQNGAAVRSKSMSAPIRTRLIP